MFSMLQVLTVLLVAVALALALAHALELPGKLRLTKEAYFAMQPIYYPGFTIGGGIDEAGGMMATILLLCLTPLGSTDFWLTLVALLGLIGVQAVYWLFTHPVNNCWLAGENLERFSAGFFSFGAHGLGWRTQRVPRIGRRYVTVGSIHTSRVGCALVSLLALAIAISCRT
jgi:hypothetical protein